MSFIIYNNNMPSLLFISSHLFRKCKLVNFIKYNNNILSYIGKFFINYLYI